MSIDVVDLREFYATPLGRSADNSLARALKRLDIITADCALAGLGYTVPLFDQLAKENGDAILLMPGSQGALQWPRASHSRVALVEENSLPLADSSQNCVVVMHQLENSAEPLAVLNEVWRILVPEGKLILVATNRRGLWTRFEHTPFGNGQPFSKRQLQNLLRKARLTPVKWDSALNYPPIRWPALVRLYPAMDRIGARLWPIFCGARVLCASKRLYQGVPSKAEKKVSVHVPVLAPQAAGSIQSRDRYSISQEPSD